MPINILYLCITSNKFTYCRIKIEGISVNFSYYMDMCIELNKASDFRTENYNIPPAFYRTTAWKQLWMQFY